jgi:5-methylcytosine-specific restriction endonuclease McrA
VKPIRPKQPRLRLDSELYDQLRKQVLRRDGWKCQCCGAKTNLEVHHKQSRSQGGLDSEENLITICAGCHSLVHYARSFKQVAKKQLKTCVQSEDLR